MKKQYLFLRVLLLAIFAGIFSGLSVHAQALPTMPEVLFVEYEYVDAIRLESALSPVAPPNVPVLSIKKGTGKNTVVITVDYPSGHAVVLESEDALPANRWVVILPIDGNPAVYLPNRMIITLAQPPGLKQLIFRARMLN